MHLESLDHAQCFKNARTRVSEETLEEGEMGFAVLC